MMKVAPRGRWKLICAYENMPNLDVLKRKAAAKQKKKPSSERAPFVAPTKLVTEKAGYIVWKDTKVVVFIQMIYVIHQVVQFWIWMMMMQFTVFMVLYQLNGGLGVNHYIVLHVWFQP
jgi:hypothetical protein